MKIDLNKFAKIIAAMNDLENSVENQEYHELLGILSGIGLVLRILLLNNWPIILRT